MKMKTRREQKYSLMVFLSETASIKSHALLRKNKRKGEKMMGYNYVLLICNTAKE